MRPIHTFTSGDVANTAWDGSLGVGMGCDGGGRGAKARASCDGPSDCHVRTGRVREHVALSRLTQASGSGSTNLIGRCLIVLDMLDIALHTSVW
eukprot:5775212-Prymnesium_polylepis.1